MANAPVQNFRIGLINAAIWKNDGRYSVTVSRSYKDGEDWKQSGSFFPDDLLNASRVLARAEDWISRQQ